MGSAAILAGGRGRRFGGRDKSALVIAGRSIRDRQLDELRMLTDDIMVVGARDPIAGTRGVADRMPGSGPLGGLDAALTAARDEEVLVLACDMPFVTAPFLRYLLDLAAEHDVVVPRTERGFHPLCAAYTRRCHSVVRQQLAARRLALSELLGLFDEVAVRVVEAHEIERFGNAEWLLANVNTPDDLDNLNNLNRVDTLEALPGHEP